MRRSRPGTRTVRRVSRCPVGGATSRPPLDSGDGVMSWYQQYLAMPDAVRPPMRSYTVRAQRPSLGELDIDFVLHPEHAGPASERAAKAAPGDEIGFVCPPRASYDPQPGAAWQDAFP